MDAKTIVQLASCDLRSFGHCHERFMTFQGFNTGNAPNGTDLARAGFIWLQHGYVTEQCIYID